MAMTWYDTDNQGHRTAGRKGGATMDQTVLSTFQELFLTVMTSDAKSMLTQPQLQPYLDRLQPHITLRWVRKGRYLIRASQVLQDVIIVAQGEFYLLRSSHKGSSSMLARVPAPDILGLPQLVGQDPVFYSDIIASENCLALCVDHVFFKQCVTESVEMAVQCMKCMADSWERSNHRFERTSFFDASENLMAYLYHRWVESGAREETLRVEEKHTLIANDLGCMVRTVCRALKRLKEQDLCTTDKAGTIYCTPEQIRRIRQQVCC